MGCRHRPLVHLHRPLVAEAAAVREIHDRALSRCLGPHHRAAAAFGRARHHADRSVEFVGSVGLKSAAAQSIVEMLRWNTVWLHAFQAAMSVAVTSRQTAKQSAISARHPGAESRSRPGRKCGEIELNADRPGDCRCPDSRPLDIHDLMGIDTGCRKSRLRSDPMNLTS